MDTKRQVYDWIESHQDEVVLLLQDLIRIPSVTGYFDEEEQYKQEGNVQAYLKNFLEEMGFATELSYPDAKELEPYRDKPGYCADHTFENRPNLYGEYKGTGNGKSLLLSGHIDVVQRGSKWTKDPFAAEIIGKKMYGRGAIDMKGGVAAMIMAFKAVKESGIRLKGDVKVGTVVDEEAGGMGTLAFVTRGYRADGCLITEPTHLNMAPLCRGILWGKIIIEGKSGHIELKQGDWREGGAVDAIDKAVMYLDYFKNLNREWAVTKNHKYLPIPCQVHFAQFEAGEYPTTFANHAELTFDAQYLPREKDTNGLGSKVKKELEDFVAAIAQTDSWLRENPPRIEWLIDADCGETEDTDPFFQQVLASIKEHNPEAIVEGNCAHTDMGWFCNVGIPTVNLGPGDSKLAHQADEYIEIPELITCTKMIASLLMDWCEVDE